jgi:Fur family transcriptional regulator, ferric uptake regulator
VTELERLCQERGIRLSQKQRAICRALSGCIDHLNAERILAEVVAKNPSISWGTVYKTLRLLEGSGLLVRHKFRLQPKRTEAPCNELYHFIDTENGRIIEFRSDQIHSLSRCIAEKLGFQLFDIKLELYGSPTKPYHFKRVHELEYADQVIDLCHDPYMSKKNDNSSN